MSGFDKDWLALREPLDHAARDPSLVAMLAAHLRRQPTEAPLLLDIGCGTGSTWRSLSMQLPAATRWQLVDHDDTLLAEAQRLIGAPDSVAFSALDLSDSDALVLDDVAVVTASAFFDLCSESFCRDLVERLGRHRCGLYAALNYSGIMAWTVPHPLDSKVLDDFNAHQLLDKGFGPALGREATALLRVLLEALGYEVRIVESLWRIGPEHGALHMALLDGMRVPVCEIGRLSEIEIDNWLAFRRREAQKPEALGVVGHLDLLALPS